MIYFLLIMQDQKFVEKITDKVWLSFLIWMGLLVLRSIINNDIFGVVAELGGFFLFAMALYKWTKRRKK